LLAFLASDEETGMDSEYKYDVANPCFTPGTKTCVEINGVRSLRNVTFSGMDVERFEVCNRAMH
jgi:hypothetical protein